MGGVGHTCALLQSGRVSCWGNNEDGQLGNNSQDTFSNTPVTVNGIESVISIASLYTHSCAALSTGTVYCWGPQDFGILGNGEISGKVVRSPVQVKNIRNAVSVATGTAQSYSILSDGTVMRWGTYKLGSSGMRENISAIPEPVVGISNAIQVAAAVGRGLAGGASGNRVRNSRDAILYSGGPYPSLVTGWKSKFRLWSKSAAGRACG